MARENLAKQIFFARPVSTQICEAGARFLGNGTDGRAVVAGAQEDPIRGSKETSVRGLTLVPETALPSGGNLS